jgi:NADH-quinone oxidoreductase subunit G
MDDVAKDTVLNVSERGDRALVGKFEGKDLTHPWAANIIDLCPVGALLSKDFLNKARAWELDRSASICPSCTQGCNITIEVRDNNVARLKPRPNDDVNKFFMCDHGRLN